MLSNYVKTQRCLSDLSQYLKHYEEIPNGVAKK